MDRSIVGSRVRQRRREMGVTQVDLAQRIGISPSYLNLIEWNKRQIAGTLMRRIADALDLDELDVASDRRLLEVLTEIAHLPSIAALDIEADRTGELIGRFPGWARCVAALAHSEREATAKVQTLTDRLSNDPFLGEAVHRMLTRIAAIRSASEILTDFPDAPQDRRDRFNQIIYEESRALSDVGEALAAYFDKADDPDRVLTPLDEVESFFEARDNHFAEIEAAASALASQLIDPHPVSRQASASEFAEENLTDLIDQIVTDQPQIKTAAAGVRARRALLAYGALATLMPMEGFADQAATLRYDVEALADAFSVDVEAVCRRLTALPRTDGVPRFGYYRANAAGTIVEMLALPGLSVPRYAAVCPLWVLYRAQQSPESVIRQRAVFPSGAHLIFVARARSTGPTGFGKPRHYLTDMLAMSEGDAAHTVYAPDRSVQAEEVGPSCRLCPRRSCGHRVEDPLSA